MRSSIALAVAAAGVLGAAAIAGPAPGPDDPACTLPSGWSAVAARKTRYVIFGEIHGTRQSPEFVAATACGLARQGERLLVAIEQDAGGNDALQAAWKLPNARFAEALQQKGWAGREDGVGSEAMLAMLVRLHALSLSGSRIDVVAFNGMRDAAQRARFAGLPGQGPHEAAQAENIRNAAKAKAYDHVLVLVGSLHARKRPAEPSGITFEPMAMRLAPPADVTSLMMLNSGGSAWNCILRAGVVLEHGKPLPPDAIECASHAAQPAVDLSGGPSVGLGSPPGLPLESDYDGYFWIGAVTASPPAVPKR